jgi:hypothetical protein
MKYEPQEHLVEVIEDSGLCCLPPASCYLRMLPAARFLPCGYVVQVAVSR